MKRMNKIGTVLTMLMFPAAMFAQGNGEIHGKVLDKKDTPAFGAIVWVENGGTLTKSGIDDEGRFVLKPLNGGSYTVFIRTINEDTLKYAGVNVDAGLITSMKDVDLSSQEVAAMLIGEVEIVYYKDKLICAECGSMQIVRAKELAHSPAKRNITQIVASQTSGVKVNDNGDAYVRGSRADAINYYMDGMRVPIGFKSPPASSIASVQVYTGGVPAKYGDCTGGVVVIETQSYFNLYNEWMAQQNAGK